MELSLRTDAADVSIKILYICVFLLFSDLNCTPAKEVGLIDETTDPVCQNAVRRNNNKPQHFDHTLLSP